MPPEKSSTATEFGRFNFSPMATDLTVECARKYLAELQRKEKNTFEADIESGKATRDIPEEEIASWFRR